ncbi:MAG: hypothetical protein J6X94_11500 [Lachnospiraceae bacterium]|nr:hypothetical protein [Lachnospiraceae bacterium]
MKIIDALLDYWKYRDKSILITSDLEISIDDLNVVVVKILSWLKLQYQRSRWIAEGRKTSFKPLLVNVSYSWGAELKKLVENESLFSDYFSLNDGKFDFLDTLSEDDKNAAIEKVNQYYNPQIHI